MANLELLEGDTKFNSYGSLDNNYQLITLQKETTEDNAGFTVIHYSPDASDVTAVLLENCTKFVLRPYNIFLCAIGWKKFYVPQFSSNKRCLNTMCRTSCSVANIWPCILTILLIVSCITQILLCFTRDSVPSDPPINGTYYINCSSHIISSFIIPDILLVGTYLYGLIIFRLLQPDDLSVMTQKVFCSIEEKKSKWLALSMLILLISGVAWIIYSLGVSILRVFAHNLNQNVKFEFLPSGSDLIKSLLLIFSQLGFVVYDISYASVVINYAMQCQLIIYSLDNICTGLLNKSWATIDESIMEINITRKSLIKLNGHLSRATSTIMFIFLYSSVTSLYNLQQLETTQPTHDLIIIGVTGFLAAIQWTLWLFMPLIQAARVTHLGNKLQDTALEIRSRPFQYRDTSQIDLDSLVTYCSNAGIKARLVAIPVYPEFVFGGIFLLGFTFYMVLKFDNYAWIPWL